MLEHAAFVAWAAEPLLTWLSRARRYIGQTWKGDPEAPQSRSDAVKTILTVVAIYACFLGASSAYLCHNMLWRAAADCVALACRDSALLHGPRSQEKDCSADARTQGGLKAAVRDHTHAHAIVMRAPPLDEPCTSCPTQPTGCGLIGLLTSPGGFEHSIVRLFNRSSPCGTRVCEGMAVAGGQQEWPVVAADWPVAAPPWRGAGVSALSSHAPKRSRAEVSARKAAAEAAPQTSRVRAHRVQPAQAPLKPPSPVSGAIAELLDGFECVPALYRPPGAVA